MGNRPKLIAKNLTVVYRGRTGVGREGKEVARTFKDPKEGEAFVKDMRKRRPGVTPRGNMLLKTDKKEVFDPLNILPTHFKNGVLKHVVLVKRYNRGAFYIRTLDSEGKTIDSLFDNGQGHAFYRNSQYSYYHNIYTGKKVYTYKDGTKKIEQLDGSPRPKEKKGAPIVRPQDSKRRYSKVGPHPMTLRGQKA